MTSKLHRRFIVLTLLTSIIMTFSGCTSESYSHLTDNDISAPGTANSWLNSFYTSQVRHPTAEEAEKYPQLTNLPVMYITLEDTKISDITKETYIPGKYTLVYGEEGGIYDEPIMIKGRGNYSWDLPKKPYTIKLAKETALLGMGSAKKWVLIGEYADKTLLRNYLTMKLAIKVGLDYSPDCRFVDVYFNGEYNGNYLMTDAIEIYPTRVDIDKETEAVFEIEATYRHSDHTECIDVVGGAHHVLYKRPSNNNIFPETRAANLERFRDFFQGLNNSLSQGYDEYSKYIDVNSFVDWYLVNEFVKNFDSGFTSSCYCYIKDGKVYMGPVWDYHTCYGNQDVATCLRPSGYHVAKSPWYKILTKDETFKQLLHSRWTQLRDEGVFDDFISQIPELTEYISASAEKNYEVWTKALRYNGLRGSKSKYTFEEEIEYLIDWTLKRIEWLDKEWYIK